MRISIFLFLLVLGACRKEKGTEPVPEKPSPDVLVYTPEKMSDGYTLVAPLNSKNIYLIDKEGFVVKKWEATHLPGPDTWLLPNGQLLRAEKLPNADFSAGGSGGRIHLFNWDNTIAWEFDWSTATELQHHDVKQLPNGNFLLTVWEKHGLTEILERGKIPPAQPLTEMWFDKIMEVKPTGPTSGTVVWEWKSWDHLIQDYDSSKPNYGNVSQHPERIDINYNFLLQGGAANFMHINGVEYVPEYDQIILSVRNFSEIWIIDHSTTTAEAATGTGGIRGKGGDLLYRWGNAFGYQVGQLSDRKLFTQHNPTWISNLPNHGGNLLVFNNELEDANGEPFSTINEIKLPHTNGNFNLLPSSALVPSDYAWTYTQQGFYSRHLSSALRFANGNTLLCEGDKGLCQEITHEGEVVWKYQLPVPQGSLFKALRYAPDYGAFHNKQLARTGQLVE